MSELDPARNPILSNVAGLGGDYDAREHLAAKKDASRVLHAHLHEISGDTTGTDPADYLTPEEVEVCREIVDLAHQDGVNLEGRELEMLTPRSSAYSAWSSPKHTAKAGLTKALFFRRQIIGHGLQIGRLQLHPQVPVMLCVEDGLLYSRRGDDLRRSEGLGWGSLPDPDILTAALATRQPAGVPVPRLIDIEGAHLDQEGQIPALAKVLLSQIPRRYIPDPADSTPTTMHGLPPAPPTPPPDPTTPPWAPPPTT